MKKLKQIIAFIWKHPLAGKHMLKALYRFFSWQFVQSLFPHKRAVTLIENTQIYMRKGLSGATGNYYTGLLEFSEMAFLLHFLREDDCFADVGANVGVYTLLASGYCGATTLAFEPVPSTFNWLQQNIELNRLQSRVIAYNEGVGALEGVLLFSTGYDTVNHVMANQEDGAAIKVKVNTLEHFFNIHGIPLLMKVDVEGYETEVINGLGSIINSEQLKALIIELNGSGGRYGYDEKALHQRLVDAGFVPHAYDPFARELKRLDDKGSHNTIYVRDIVFIQERIRNAAPVRIFGEAF